MATRLLLVCLLTFAPRAARSQEAPTDAASAQRLFRIDAQTPQELQDLFHYAGELLPWSARTGAVPVAARVRKIMMEVMVPDRGKLAEFDELLYREAPVPPGKKKYFTRK